MEGGHSGVLSFRFGSLILIAQVLFVNLLLAAAQHGDGVNITRGDYGALKELKSKFVDLRGHLRSWDGDKYDACSGGWIGIKCVRGHVIAVQLPWKGLGGKISESIGLLRRLRKLSLHDNVLSGPIPKALSFLPDLRGVFLFNNRLSGSIPPSLGLNPVLQSFDVSNNSLSGMIPPTLAISTRLLRLNLSYNSFIGSIPVTFAQSYSLIFLALEHNNLSGSIPDLWLGIGNKSHQLQILTLDYNYLSGSFPVSLGQLDRLQVLSVGHNQISGIIPDELSKIPSLQMLDLSNNAFNGSFPSTFSNFPSLTSLNLEGNQLSGQIPDTVAKLQNLTALNLKNNRFSGHIPVSLGNISSLSALDLSDNDFSGEIPSSIASLLHLSSFNVSNNNLSGSVVPSLAQKFNSSSFAGNLQLCGYSIQTPCPSTPETPSPQPSPESLIHGGHHHRLSAKDIILIVTGILLVIVFLLCCVLLCCLIRKRAASKEKSAKGAAEKAISVVGAPTETNGGKLVHFDGPFVFTADDLLCATAEIMGKSSYGTAYKAILEDGKQVVVKRLREKAVKGQKEFEAEVVALGKLRHENILPLRAYYLGPKGEKLLVFDCMPKGSLASFLHARGPEAIIDWPTRMKIAMGITRGLHYLHAQEDIIHGNLTSTNILLDEQTNPHIAEVGLSQLMTAAANTNIIATAGSQGYGAPELSKLKKPTTKTDIYSLGIIILELMTGKSPGEHVNGMDLPQWVASIVKEEWTNEVFNLELLKDAASISDELLNTLKLAMRCTDPSPAARPEAQQVLLQLEEIKPELAAPATPVEEKTIQEAP
uniref:Protein kinase domain-containing protein n=1 Tax=Kalanchoe fedtschenkoi TaxID=63787 RepID=A0A7N0T860_KALFE